MKPFSLVRMGCLYGFVLILALGAVTYAFFALINGLTSQWTSLAVFLPAAIILGLSAYLIRQGFMDLLQREDTGLHLRQKHPQKPWLWRDDWASGKIIHSYQGSMREAWGFAGFWNLVLSPLALAIPLVQSEGLFLTLLCALCPVVGVFFFIRAIFVTRYWKKTGVSTLEPDSCPIPPGGEVSGMIRTGFDLEPGQTFHLRLYGTIDPTINGDYSPLRPWETRQILEKVMDKTPHWKRLIPIQFQIPQNAAETRDDTDNPIRWFFEVKSALSGMNYKASFELPLFRAQENTVAFPPQKLSEDMFKTVPDNPQQRLARIGIVIQPNTDKGAVITYAAARNPKTIAADSSITLFCVGSWVGLLFIPGIFTGWGITFLCMWGLVVLANLFSLFKLLFQKTIVTLAPGKITIARGYCGTARTLHTIRKEEVSEIVASGKDIRIDCGDDRTVAAGTGIPAVSDALWLAAEMRRLIDKTHDPE